MASARQADVDEQVLFRLPADAMAALRRIAGRRGSRQIAPICREGVIAWLRSEGELPPYEDTATGDED